MTNEARTTYRFGPLERHGLLGPIRTAQAISVVAAVVIAIGLIDLMPSAYGAVLGMSVIALAAALVTVPLGGRTIDAWVPIGASHLLRRTTQRTHHQALTPVGGRTSSDRGSTGHSLELPDTLVDLELVEVEHGGLTLGAISEHGGRRLTAALACRVDAFTLLDPPAQARRLAHWGTLLSSAAGTPIRRLQWIERTVPAQTDELARWLNAARDPSIPPRGAPIVESYLELIGSGARVTHAHEVLLALQVDGGMTRGRGRAAEAARVSLVEQIDRFARGLEAAEVRVLGAVGRSQLARVLRTGFDPYAGAELAALAAAGAAVHASNNVAAGPLGTKESWDHYRCDGALHSTYWIAGWPRSEVPATFLDPLLGSSQTVRTVAVTFEAVPPERSTRDVEAAITRDRADSELRRRFGQAETARHRQAYESARRRETELAVGHGEVRLAGFVTVSGRDETELRHACDELVQQAARSRLELRRMYGQQAEAFTFTLPIARGLR